MRILLPSNFDVARDVKGYQKKYREKYLWVIHTIIEESYQTKKDFLGYVNLQSKIIEKFLGSKYYKDILESLEQSGVIEINSAYSVSQFSKSYRISKKISNAVIRQNFIGGKADGYITKLKQWKQQQIKLIFNDAVYNQLWKNLNGLTFDAIKARKYLDENEAKFTEGELSSRHWTIDKFEISDYFFKVDDATGRVYNNLTNLPRDLRQFVALASADLIQIDISNSQPLLFCPFLKIYWKDYQKVIRPYFDRSRGYNSFAMLTGLEKDIYISENGHNFFLSHLLHFESPHDDLPEDMLLYIQLTQKGKFYEAFMDYLKAEEIDDLPPRDVFKVEFFTQVFFSTNNRVKAKKYEEWFHLWMPNVSKAISWFKREDHAALAIKMQKVEADVIFGTCRDLLNLSPVPYFLTIHDAIVCESKDALTVQYFVLMKFTELFGLRPTAKIKALSA